MIRRITSKPMNPARWSCLILAAAALTGAAPGVPFLASPQSAMADVSSPSCWQADVVPNEDAAAAGRDRFTDFLMFDSLGFSAEAMAKLGFPSVDVTVAETGAFSVSADSERHGTMTWAGTMSDGRLNGTLTWARDGQIYIYNFTGVTVRR